MEDDSIEQQFKELDYKFLGLCKRPKLLCKVTNDGLPILMNMAIKYEEYEICGLIKQEIKKRNL